MMICGTLSPVMLLCRRVGYHNVSLTIALFAVLYAFYIHWMVKKELSDQRQFIMQECMFQFMQGMDQQQQQQEEEEEQEEEDTRQKRSTVANTTGRSTASTVAAYERTERGERGERGERECSGRDNFTYEYDEEAARQDDEQIKRLLSRIEDDDGESESESEGEGESESESEGKGEGEGEGEGEGGCEGEDEGEGEERRNDESHDGETAIHECAAGDVDRMNVSTNPEFDFEGVNDENETEKNGIAIEQTVRNQNEDEGGNSPSPDTDAHRPPVVDDSVALFHKMKVVELKKQAADRGIDTKNMNKDAIVRAILASVRAS